MTFDVETIPGVEPLQETKLGQLGKFAFRTTVARLAGQHEVPHTIEPLPKAKWLERVWEKMIHIGQIFG